MDVGCGESQDHVIVDRAQSQQNSRGRFSAQHRIGTERQQRHKSRIARQPERVGQLEHHLVRERDRVAQRHGGEHPNGQDISPRVLACVQDKAPPPLCQRARERITQLRSVRFDAWIRDVRLRVREVAHANSHQAKKNRAR
jgi:hypothetical protein